VTRFMRNTVDTRLIEEVQSLIEQNRRNALKLVVKDMRPADLADLIEHLAESERIAIFQLLEPEWAGDVLVEIEPPVKERILKALDNNAISEIVAGLDSDDAADLVGDLPAERAREVIESVDDHVSEELEKLLPYPDDTAGGIMALEYLAVKASATVGDAIGTVREEGKEIENLYYIWVVDDLQRLAGVISIKDLVLEPDQQKISDIMNPDVISVTVDQDQEEVANIVSRYDLVSIPVVDDQYRLVGSVTHDDIIDVIEEEIEEDMNLMAGVIDQEITEESTIRISRARLPWLIAALFGGILAAAVINQFETSIRTMISLSFFFPVVMAMGGNTGTQAATVVVRGLATGDIGMVNIAKRLWMELRVAFINGVICGIILGVIVGFWVGDYRLGLMVNTALFLIILLSGLIGASVPLVLKRLNIDPALAAGPFVTTSNDILSLFIYLGLATFFLRAGA
jgi:magnesium transporter